MSLLPFIQLTTSTNHPLSHHLPLLLSLSSRNYPSSSPFTRRYISTPTCHHGKPFLCLLSCKIIAVIFSLHRPLSLHTSLSLYRPLSLHLSFSLSLSHSHSHAMPFSLFFSLLLLATTLPPSSSITTHSRRSLHEPFFPLSTPPPPPLPPPPSPSIPKYPSSSIPTDPSTPFFPLDPSTPPPPTTPSLPTFPANISSLSFPNSPSTPHHPAATKLLPTIVLPLLALSLVSIVLTFFLLRRRRRNHTNSADKQSLSAAGKRSTTSEFLYLGTLVNSCRRADDDPITAAAAAVSPYYKLSSPELRPLPPLTRQNYANAACSSDEEFYSPRSSSAEKESPAELLAGHLSSSLTTFPTTTQNGGSPSSTLSTPSYPSSNSASSPPIGSSPARSTVKSVKSARSSRSSTERASEIRLSVSTSPPPPPPPPLTPSPPKPKPPFPSSPSRISTQRIPQNPLAENVILQLQTAPPPPPPPPAGYWESRVRRPQASQPADLATPVSMELKNFTTGEMSGNSDSAEKREETPRPKLKPLHWDKVRASSDRATVWDQLKSSSFQVNEEMIESLFVCNPSNAMPKESDKQQVLTPGKQEDRVLDPKKSHNIAILLRALNVTKEEVCEALMDGNTDSLGAELLETLVKMAPSKEEEIKLKEHTDDSPVKLGPAEKFLKAVLDIPFAFKRVDAMLYIANFDSEVKYLKDSFETLEAACEELRSSRLFLKLLEAVLKSGNRMNIGTNRGDAHAFKLDTLLKLVDIKGADGKTTLLHFVVQEMIRTEGSRLSAANPSASKTEPSTPQDDLKYKKLGLHAVAGLKDELANVKKAAAMDSDVLSSYVSKLAGGIGKVSEVMRLDERQGSKESGSRFHESISGFLKKAENGIIKVQAQESVALSLVKEITEYFHGNSTKEEAHPFRIFMVVRDFMSILDQVCKEVGRVSQPSYVSSARQLPVPVNPTLLPLFPRLNALRAGSSDDESSSSS